MEYHDVEYNTMHTELVLKNFMYLSARLYRNQQELDQTKEKLNQTDTDLNSTKSELHQTKERLVQTEIRLNQTEKKLVQTEKKLNETEKNQEKTEGLIINVCSVLQKSVTGKHIKKKEPNLPKRSFGFKEMLPLLSQDAYEEFINMENKSILKTIDLYNYCQLVCNMRYSGLSTFNYKLIFKWVLKTMEPGEIYRAKRFAYIKLPIENQENGKIVISETNNLENFKRINIDTLVFENENLALFWRKQGHHLVYRSVLGWSSNVCLFGAEIREKMVCLKHGKTVNNVVWKDHATEGFNEVMFEIKEKLIFQEWS